VVPLPWIVPAGLARNDAPSMLACNGRQPINEKSETDRSSSTESGPQQFAELVDAPIVALGLSSSAADALEQALGVRTVRELADNKYVRRAQAIVSMAKAGTRFDP
jgi:hypothetical protein